MRGTADLVNLRREFEWESWLSFPTLREVPLVFVPSLLYQLLFFLS